MQFNCANNLKKPQLCLKISSLCKSAANVKALSWGRGWGEGGRFNSSSPHF
jgi:hypothetical protein